MKKREILIRRLKKALALILSGNFIVLAKKASTILPGRFVKLIDEEELKPKFKKALLFLKEKVNGKKEIGDYLEFGVCHGSSLLCMHQVLKESEIDNVRLFGFDSFEGLPEVAATDGVWNPGDFYAGFEKVKNYLTKKGIDWNRVTLTKGWFKDTLNLDFIRKYKIKKASIIMIDCDIYQSTKEALNFCKNLIKDKTIIFFDDWNSSGLATKNLGEKRAFDEFLNENPQFTAQKFDSYSYQGNPNGEIYLVSSS